MTDISTQQQLVARPPLPSRRLRLLLALLKPLFRSQRTVKIDLIHGNAHFLKDIGVSRRHDAPQIPPFGRIL